MLGSLSFLPQAIEALKPRFRLPIDTFSLVSFGQLLVGNALVGRGRDQGIQRGHRVLKGVTHRTCPRTRCRTCQPVRRRRRIPLRQEVLTH